MDWGEDRGARVIRLALSKCQCCMVSVIAVADFSSLPQDTPDTISMSYFDLQDPDAGNWDGSSQP
jgi:hypothetical protein